MGHSWVDSLGCVLGLVAILLCLRFGSYRKRIEELEDWVSTEAMIRIHERSNRPVAYDGPPRLYCGGDLETSGAVNTERNCS